MSGFAVVWRRSGRPVEPTSLRRLVHSRDRSGNATGATVAIHGPCGLAQAGGTPATVPEARGGPNRQGGPSVVGDVRLSGREALAHRLGRRRPESDLAMIAQAYRTWGPACVEHLVGAFAFALWDSQRRELFLARDHFGQRSLSFAITRDGDVVVAPDPRAVLALGEVDDAPDPGFLASFLDLLPHRHGSPYARVEILPAAHTCTISGTGRRDRRFWTATTPSTVPLEPDDWTAAVRDAFLTAVGDAMDEGPMGAHLSGGVDSSSVVCAAATLAGARAPLHAFTARFAGGRTDADLRAVQTVLQASGARGHDVDGDAVVRPGDLTSLLDFVGYPIWNPFLLVYDRIYQAAAPFTTAVLDGMDGDAVAFQSYFPLRHWARTGRWLRLHRELSATSRRLQVPRLALLKTHVLRAEAPWLYRAKARLRGEDEIPLLHPDLASEADPAILRRLHRRFDPDDGSCPSDVHARRVESAIIPFTLSTLGRVAQRWGVEARHPFFDLRLVSLCLSAPTGLKFRAGISRYVLRAALSGILPEAVRWRADKGNPIPAFFEQVVRSIEPELERAERSSRGLVADHTIERLRKRYADHRRPRDAYDLWRAFAVGHWLTHENAPAWGAETGPIRVLTRSMTDEEQEHDAVAEAVHAAPAVGLR